MPKQISGAAFKVFVLDDDNWYRDLLVYVTSLNPDYEVKKFSTGKDLMNAIHENPNVITLDYMLPDTNGETLLKQIKEFNPYIEVIVISEQEKIDTAISLLRLGAYDYIVKTPDIKDKLLNLINNIRNNQSLKSKVERLEKEVHIKYDYVNFIVGQSETMQHIYAMVTKACETNITTVITGETGTGKEVIAKTIHFNSKRQKGPFVAVNMTAIPKELAESELFGHEKGAFTGAVNTRVGRFEEANGGTLLLDEIAEMDISLQAKLLRVLQEKEVSHVGSGKLIKVDCRIIACTNKDLLEEVKHNRFREDLYYRLLGLQIHLPPLRQRGNDIILLAKYFTDLFCKENEIAARTFSQEANQKLLTYQFPGNVRELKSVVELAVSLSETNIISAENIILRNNNSFLKSLLNEEYNLREYDMIILNHFLNKYENNIPLVAEKLNIGKSTIYNMLKEKETKIKIE